MCAREWCVFSAYVCGVIKLIKRCSRTSVCELSQFCNTTSFDYAVVSENGDESPDSESELQFLLQDRIDQLTDKKSVQGLSRSIFFYLSRLQSRLCSLAPATVCVMSGG